MKLFYRKTGSGFPLIILHGLYGSSDNWMTIAKHLAVSNTVILPDLRNHGQSPHDDEMDFNCMTDDILELLLELKIDKFILMGHSMGGKLSLKIASDHPEFVEKLIIVDIAPRSYFTGYSKHFEFHKNIINILLNLHPENFTLRNEAEQVLLEKLPNINLVRFLIKNLRTTTEGGYTWKINIQSIHRNLYKLIDGVDEENDDKPQVFLKPALFIKGEKSDYIEDEDLQEIKKMFPDLRFENVQNAGHWVHAEQPVKFLEIVKKFIS
jgi:pimeloyl-ACP methyl ester carboxylesterase